MLTRRAFPIHTYAEHLAAQAESVLLTIDWPDTLTPDPTAILGMMCFEFITMC